MGKEMEKAGEPSGCDAGLPLVKERWESHGGMEASLLSVQF